MKKTTKIIFIVLSIMTLLLSIVALTMDVGVEAAKSDIDLYHIGGFLMNKASLWLLLLS